jgi:hypothetical protein
MFRSNSIRTGAERARPRVALAGLALSFSIVLSGADKARTETVRPQVEKDQIVQISIQARPAEKFVDSMGINVHMESTQTPYVNYPFINRSLRALGMRHFRDGSTTPVRRSLPK